MSTAQLIDYTGQALTLILFLSLPPIIVAALVGTLVSLFQALTQIQEQTISFAFKLVAVIVTIALTARWLGDELFDYGMSVMQVLPQL
jgi:type III secretion protein S